jgi:hypothetical protein
MFEYTIVCNWCYKTTLTCVDKKRLLENAKSEGWRVGNKCHICPACDKALREGIDTPMLDINAMCGVTDFMKGMVNHDTD